jgi:hypothetical protein
VSQKSLRKRDTHIESLTKGINRCLDSIDCCQSARGTITSSGLGFKLETLTNMTKSTIYLVDHTSP